MVFSSKAAHIIGGEVTYRCLGGNDYEFTMTIYRDCGGGGALFDSQTGANTVATVSVYKDGEIFPFIPSEILGAPTITNILPNVSNPCLIVPDDVCVEEGIYVFNLNLPSDPLGYHIVYQRCCRNNTISNIIDPAGTGATYTIELKPEAQQVGGVCTNSSPTFNDFPPIIICANEPINFDHSATDPDGDQLVYKFCSPKKGGGTQGTNGNPGSAASPTGVAPDPDSPPPFENVTYIPPLSPINPMNGNPPVMIDPSTGFLTGEPTALGQFVVGICVEEFRNGQLLSVVSRDFQFNVESCEPTVFARIENDGVINGSEFVVNSCGNNTVTFINSSFDQDFIDTYNWTFPLGNGDTVNLTSENAVVTFPDLGTYQGQLILNIGSPCDDTALINVNIYPEIQADFSSAFDTCVAGPVSFTNASFSGSGNITGYEWNFGDGDFDDAVNPNHLYDAPGDIPCLLYTSPSPRDATLSRMPSSA